MSLTIVPEKPFKPMKQKQKVIVSSLVCQFDPNEKQKGSNHQYQHQYAHLQKQTSLVPRKSNDFVLRTYSCDKSYKMQTGLKSQKSIVRTKKKRVIITKSKPLPNFTSRVKALKDHKKAFYA